jgi:hypothetical protein
MRKEEKLVDFFLSTCKIRVTLCCQKLKVRPIYSKKAEQYIYIYIYIYTHTYMTYATVLLHYSSGQKVEKVI